MNEQGGHPSFVFNDPGELTGKVHWRTRPGAHQAMSSIQVS